MISLQLFRPVLDYHYWARDRLLAACAPASPRSLNRTVRGCDWSILGKLSHMVADEQLCLRRCQGQQAPVPDGPGSPRSLAELAARWQASETGMRRYVGSLSQASLQNPPPGAAALHARWRLVFDLVDAHSRARGELSVALRQAGLEVPYFSFLHDA